jgi:hypothetical protein
VERGPGSWSGGRRGSFGLAAVALIALAATACTATTSPSPQASASPSASATPSASAIGSTETASPSPSPTPSPTAFWTPDLALTPSPTVAPDDNPTDATPTPPLPKGPLPSVGPVPTGNWTGIKWIAIPGGHSPAIPPYTEDYTVNDTLEGWSQGYLELMWNPYNRTLTPWVSTDGLNWSSGSRIDISLWSAQFKGYDQGLDAADRADCGFEVVQFEEGPANLLLRGKVACSGGCGGPWYTTETMWSSTDAKSWTPIDMPKIFGAGGIGPISGGSSGFVALGASHDKQTIWTSSDGQNWEPGALPPAALATGSWANDPASFAGGFVLPGVVLEAKGHGFVPPNHSDYGYGGGYTDGGCVGRSPTDFSMYRAAIWWSPDGSTWTRATLSGTTAASSVDMEIYRIDDHTLIAQQIASTEDRVLTSWISTDGKSWMRLVSRFPELLPWQLIVGRTRGFIYDYGWAGGEVSTIPATTLSVFTPDFRMADLKQTGDAPWIDEWQTALGPTGLLVTEDGSQFWIGVPTAG